MAAHAEKHQDQGKEDHPKEAHHDNAAHGNDHAPKGRERWYRKIWTKWGFKKSDFETKSVVRSLRDGLIGGTGLAWLHSSILFPSLALSATAAFLIHRFLKDSSGHGTGHGGGGH